MYRKVLEYKIMFWNVQKKYRNCTERYRNGQNSTACTEKYWNVQKSTGMYRKVLKCTLMF